MPATRGGQDVEGTEPGVKTAVPLRPAAVRPAGVRSAVSGTAHAVGLPGQQRALAASREPIGTRKWRDTRVSVARSWRVLQISWSI